ncbi:MAG: hypothetical protein ACTHJI_10665, partial [Leifsonia sp.]
QTLLATLRDVAMAGDDEKVAILERPLAQRIRNEPDQRRAVELMAELFTDIGSRYGEIDAVLRGAAHGGEPGLRELWETSEQQRLVGARAWVTALSEKGPLRAGVELDHAVDVLWLYMAPDQFHRLVHGRGWSRARFQNWLTETLCRLMLPHGEDGPSVQTTKRTERA